MFSNIAVIPIIQFWHIVIEFQVLLFDITDSYSCIAVIQLYLGMSSWCNG